MRTAVFAAGVCLSMIGTCFAQISTAAVARIETRIPPQTLESALKQFAKLDHIRVLSLTADVHDLRTAGASGNLTADEALTRILIGTGLKYVHVDPDAVSIVSVRSGNKIERHRPLNDVEEHQSKTTQSKEAKQLSDRMDPPVTQSTRDSTTHPHPKQALAEVVITGSRLLITSKDGPQEVEIYSRAQIDQSGQMTTADFLNTVPAISLNANEQGFSTQSGGTAVQLHGLPIGTTLVLIDGHRVESSAIQAGSGSDFFDINNIPLAAVDRVEVVPAGGSAVYGADAIAGVVNIILRKNIQGFDADVESGWAQGLQQTDTSFAWGRQGNRGAASFLGSFTDRGALRGGDRLLTADQNYTPFGGPDSRQPTCPLADIYSTGAGNLPGTNSPYAAVDPTSTHGHYTSTPGTLNLCSVSAYAGILPETRRWGGLLEGHYDLTGSLTAFMEVIYSHVQEAPDVGPNTLFGLQGFQQFTVSASNPYNPYGETVGVSQLLTSVGDVGLPTDTQYVRPLVGLRGDMFRTWHWEVNGFWSSDRTNFAETNYLDPVATQAALNSANASRALDPFVAAAGASPQILQSLLDNYRIKYDGQTDSATAFVRGPLISIGSGTVDTVLGVEYGRDSYDRDNFNDPFSTSGRLSFSRTRHAAFAEARLPVIGGPTSGSGGDRLAVTLAGRYDNYSDFGGKFTPQYGIEFRPVASLLLRASYGRAFKAPTLPELRNPQITVQTFLSDPLLGNQFESVTLLGGGDSNLHPETGSSRTIGLVYSSASEPDLTLSITNWRIVDRGNIQIIDAQAIVDNPDLFPGRVTRSAACSSGPPCPIVQVEDSYANFGEVNAAGLDYDLRYRLGSEIGAWNADLGATQTYHYEEGLTPGAAAVNAVSAAQDSGAWAPRWKGLAGLGWSFTPTYRAHIDGRYVGRYRDYDSTREIGNFWLFDGNVRFAAGSALAADRDFLRGVYIELGGTNLLNRMPQFSNYQFGFVGYDPAEADIRGRFFYVKAGEAF